MQALKFAVQEGQRGALRCSLGPPAHIVIRDNCALNRLSLSVSPA